LKSTTFLIPQKITNGNNPYFNFSEKNNIEGPGDARPESGYGNASS
jgi:hypothetical protein